MPFTRTATLLEHLTHPGRRDLVCEPERFFDAFFGDLAVARGLALGEDRKIWTSIQEIDQNRGAEELLRPLRSLEWFDDANCALRWLPFQANGGRTSLRTPFAVLGLIVRLSTSARIRVPHGALRGLRDAWVAQQAAAAVGSGAVTDARRHLEGNVVLLVVLDGPGYHVPEVVAVGPSQPGGGDAEVTRTIVVNAVYLPLHDVAIRTPPPTAADFDNALSGALAALLRDDPAQPDAWKAAFARLATGLNEARQQFRTRLRGALEVLIRLLEETRGAPASDGDLLTLRDAASILAYRTMFLLELERRGRLYLAGAPAVSFRGSPLRRTLAEIFAYAPTAPGAVDSAEASLPGAALVRVVATSRAIRGDASADDLAVRGPSIFANRPNEAFDDKVVAWLAAVDGLADVAASAGTGGDRDDLLARWDAALRTTGAVMLGHLDDESTAELNLIGGAAARHRHRVLGNIYEQILEMTPHRDKSGIRLRAKGGKDDRAALGAHYTPAVVVAEVVRPTLGALFRQVYAAAGKDPSAYRERLTRLRIIDPAMGSAHFLTVAALELAREIAWVDLQHRPRFVALEGWDEPLTHRNPIGPDEVLGERTEAYIDPSQEAAFEAAVQAALPGVIQRSIFGVDINPLAVELAKLSLWLFEVVEHRDVPNTVDDYPSLTFLDGNLRCGDSVIGLSLDEVAAIFDEARPGDQDANFDLFVDRRETLEDRISEIRRVEAKIRDDAPDAGGPDDYARRRAAYEKAEALVAGLDWLFDLALFLKLRGYTGRSSAKRAEAVHEVVVGRPAPKVGGANAARQAVDKALADLLASPFEANAGQIALRDRLRAAFRDDDPTHPIRPFHWPLRFPAAVLAGGFDAVVANPPFIGDRQLRGCIGDGHVDFLAAQYTGGKVSEYAGYFFHRFAELVGRTGSIGTLATNSIAQASNREYVLFPLLNGVPRRAETRLRVLRAVRSRVWPGEAKVHYAMMHFAPAHIANMPAPRLVEPRWNDELDDDDSIEANARPTPQREEVRLLEHGTEVSSYLDDYPDSILQELPSTLGDPGLWTGIFLRGNFSVHREPGDGLLAAIAAIPLPERDALAAYFNAEAVQHNPTPQPCDVVIDFFQPLFDAGKGDAEASEQAAWLADHYPTLWPQLQTRSPHQKDELTVFEQRARLRGATAIDREHAQRWFLYGSVRHGLRRAWHGRSHVYGFSAVIKVWAPVRLPLIDPSTALRMCPMHKLFLAPTDSFVWFGVTSSLLFEQIVRRQCSTLETRLNFSPTDVFPYFAYPWPSRWDAEAQRVCSDPPPDGALQGALADVAQQARELLAVREAVLLDPVAHGIPPRVYNQSQWGPTKLYNLYDDPTVNDDDVPGVARLRAIHAGLLQAVLRAYGWDELASDAGREAWGFDRPWIDGTQRFVPSREVRREIYARMAALNIQRYAEELALLAPVAGEALIGRSRPVSPASFRSVLKDRGVAVSEPLAAALLAHLADEGVAIAERDGTFHARR